MIFVASNALKKFVVSSGTRFLVRVKRFVASTKQFLVATVADLRLQSQTGQARPGPEQLPLARKWVHILKTFLVTRETLVIFQNFIDKSKFAFCSVRYIFPALVAFKFDS